MNARSILESALYVVLLIPALVFVHSYVVEYFKAKTIFVETSVPITLKDVPDLTFCFWYNREHYDNMTHSELRNHFEGEYMKELGITVNLKLTEQNDFSVLNTLTLNDNFKGSSLILLDFFEITLEQMHLPSEGQHLAPNSYLDNCFKVTGKSNQSERSLATNDFLLRLEIDFPGWYRINGTNNMAPAKVPTNGYFIVSTEGNSYGIGKKMWFDGEVQLVPWNMGDWMVVKIVDVTEYHFLGSDCSQKSYYQSLADRFAKFDSDSFLQRERKTTCKDDEDPNWYVNETCSPFSLPSTRNNIRTCYTRRERICYGFVMEELLKDQEEHCKSPCTIKEYKIETTRSPNPGWNSLSVDFEYSLPATTFGKHMTKKLLNKIIKTETYLITGLALLGNVGGILGIFVGFSFLGVSDWIMTGFEKIWKQHTIRRPNQKITTVHHKSTMQ